MDKTVERLIDSCGPITHVLGIDESGTGALAGSFYLAATFSMRYWSMVGVRDSKETTKEQRAELVERMDAELLHAEAPATPDDIKKHSHAVAYAKALESCLKQLVPHIRVDKKNYVVVMDGRRTARNHEVLTSVLSTTNILYIEKADRHVTQVSAASIFAKFHRDVEMNLLDKKYPKYNFSTNAGYATAEHRDAIKKFGTVPHVHRPAATST